MKSILSLTIITFLFVGKTTLFANTNQDSVTINEYTEQKFSNFRLAATNDGGLEYNNIAKINFSSFLFSNVSLQYERILGKKISVALGLRFMPKGKLPLSNTVMSFVSYDQSSEESEEGLKDFFNNTKVGGFALTPEFRYYFKKAGKGLYLAPYLRYGQYNITSLYHYVDNTEGHDITIDFKGKYTNVGAGLMLGCQFNLGQRVTLDWWILGPFVGNLKFNLNATGYTLSDEEYNAVKDDFDAFEIDFFNYKLEKNLTHSSADLSIKGLSTAIRSFGINLGIKF